MDTWKIKDNIKSGFIEFNVDDVVILFRRKGKNPRNIVFNKDYIVRYKDDNALGVSSLNDDQIFKIHKTYMVPKSYIRDIKINKLIKKSQYY